MPSGVMLISLQSFFMFIFRTDAINLFELYSTNKIVLNVDFLYSVWLSLNPWIFSFVTYWPPKKPFWKHINSSGYREILSERRKYDAPYGWSETDFRVGAAFSVNVQWNLLYKNGTLSRAANSWVVFLHIFIWTLLKHSTNSFTLGTVILIHYLPFYIRRMKSQKFV